VDLVVEAAPVLVVAPDPADVPAGGLVLKPRPPLSPQLYLVEQERSAADGVVLEVIEAGGELPQLPVLPDAEAGHGVGVSRIVERLTHHHPQPLQRNLP